jgi:hypothetical protein
MKVRAAGFDVSLVTAVTGDNYKLSFTSRCMVSGMRSRHASARVRFLSGSVGKSLSGAVCGRG